MGILHESDTYPAFETKDPFTLVGEVWEEPRELRGFESKFGKGDWYIIPILPKGAARSDDNVVALWVKPGSRMAGLSRAVKTAKDTDVRVGALIACAWDGTAIPSDKGNDMKVWKWQYRPPAAPAASSSMLGEAAADSGADAEPVNLLGD